MPDGNAITTDDAGRKNAEQDPDDRLDYPFDWSDWLAEVGDTIASHSVVTEDPTGAATPIECDESSEDAGIVTVWIRGGTVGKKHKVTCRIVTTGGREKDKTLYVKIKQQ